jgi:hypothetical protein
VERPQVERRRAERRQVHSRTGVRLRLPRTEKLTVEQMRDSTLCIRAKTGETSSVVSLRMHLVRVPNLTDDLFDLAFEFRDVPVHLVPMLGHLQSLIFD